MKINSSREHIAAKYILQDFFLAGAMLGDYMEGSRFLCALGEAYGLGEDVVRCLHEAAEADRQISSAEDYHMVMRAVQYMETMALGKDREAICRVLYGEELQDSTAETLGMRIDDVRRIKGRAYEFAEENRVACRKGADETDICRTLCAPKASRLIPVMRICGVMMCEGLFLSKDLEEGTAKLRACAMWNDTASLLPLMKYDAEQGGCFLPEDFRMMRALAENRTEEPFVHIARELYGKSLNGFACGEYAGTAQALRHAFAVNDRLSEDAYDPLYASVLSAENISLKDKEKLLLGADANRAQVMNLPLQQHAMDAVFNGEAFLEAAPQWLRSQLEDKETELLGQHHGYDSLDEYAEELMCSVMDSSPVTCIVANSKRVREAYIKAIAAGFGDEDGYGSASVMRVDISGRAPQDTACTSGSVFFRSWAPKKVNVCIVEASGDMPESTLRAAAGYLDPAYRKECYVQDLDVTLDLSAGAVICVVDEEAMEKFRSVLRAKAWTVEEHPYLREQVLREIMNTANEEREEQEADALELEDGAMRLLLAMPLDKAAEALERTIRACRGRETRITESILVDKKDREAGTVGFLRRQII